MFANVPSTYSPSHKPKTGFDKLMEARKLNSSYSHATSELAPVVFSGENPSPPNTPGFQCISACLTCLQNYGPVLQVVKGLINMFIAIYNALAWLAKSITPSCVKAVIPECVRPPVHLPYLSIFGFDFNQSADNVVESTGRVDNSDKLTGFK